MKRAFIFAERANHGIVILCHVLEVSRSGFDSWKRRPASATEEANVGMTTEVTAVHRGSRSTYGSPRVRAELWAQGRTISRNRVAGLMGLEGLQASRQRRFRTTTDSKHNLPIPPNEPFSKFEVGAPDVAWVTDIT